MIILGKNRNALDMLGMVLLFFNGLFVVIFAFTHLLPLLMK